MRAIRVRRSAGSGSAATSPAKMRGWLRLRPSTLAPRHAHDGTEDASRRQAGRRRLEHEAHVGIRSPLGPAETRLLPKHGAGKVEMGLPRRSASRLLDALLRMTACACPIVSPDPSSAADPVLLLLAILSSNASSNGTISGSESLLSTSRWPSPSATISGCPDVLARSSRSSKKGQLQDAMSRPSTPASRRTWTTRTRSPRPLRTWRCPRLSAPRGECRLAPWRRPGRRSTIAVRPADAR